MIYRPWEPGTTDEWLPAKLLLRWGDGGDGGGWGGDGGSAGWGGDGGDGFGGDSGEGVGAGWGAGTGFGSGWGSEGTGLGMGTEGWGASDTSGTAGYEGGPGGTSGPGYGSGTSGTGWGEQGASTTGGTEGYEGGPGGTSGPGYGAGTEGTGWGEQGPSGGTAGFEGGPEGTTGIGGPGAAGYQGGSTGFLGGTFGEAFGMSGMQSTAEGLAESLAGMAGPVGEAIGRGASMDPTGHGMGYGQGLGYGQGYQGGPGYTAGGPFGVGSMTAPGGPFGLSDLAYEAQSLGEQGRGGPPGGPGPGSVGQLGELSIGALTSPAAQGLAQSAQGPQGAANTGMFGTGQFSAGPAEADETGGRSGRADPTGLAVSDMISAAPWAAEALANSPAVTGVASPGYGALGGRGGFAGWGSPGQVGQTSGTAFGMGPGGWAGFAEQAGARGGLAVDDPAFTRGVSPDEMRGTPEWEAPNIVDPGRDFQTEDFPFAVPGPKGPMAPPSPFYDPFYDPIEKDIRTIEPNWMTGRTASLDPATPGYKGPTSTSYDPLAGRDPTYQIDLSPPPPSPPPPSPSLFGKTAEMGRDPTIGFRGFEEDNKSITALDPTGRDMLAEAMARDAAYAARGAPAARGMSEQVQEAWAARDPSYNPDAPESRGFGTTQTGRGIQGAIDVAERGPAFDIAAAAKANQQALSQLDQPFTLDPVATPQTLGPLDPAARDMLAQLMNEQLQASLRGPEVTTHVNPLDRGPQENPDPFAHMGIARGASIFSPDERALSAITQAQIAEPTQVTDPDLIGQLTAHVNPMAYEDIGLMEQARGKADFLTTHVNPLDRGPEENPDPFAHLGIARGPSIFATPDPEHVNPMTFGISHLANPGLYEGRSFANPGLSPFGPAMAEQSRGKGDRETPAALPGRDLDPGTSSHGRRTSAPDRPRDARPARRGGTRSRRPRRRKRAARPSSWRRSRPHHARRHPRPDRLARPRHLRAIRPAGAGRREPVPAGGLDQFGNPLGGPVTSVTSPAGTQSQADMQPNRRENRRQVRGRTGLDMQSLATSISQLVGAPVSVEQAAQIASNPHGLNAILQTLLQVDPTMLERMRTDQAGAPPCRRPAAMQAPAPPSLFAMM